MIGNKWYITDEFSKYAREYDHYAFIQKRAAKQFAELIHSRLNGIQPRFLEIGSGTGLLTEELMQRFPDSYFHITDISERMLKYAFDRTQKFEQAVKLFEELDGEDMPGYFQSDADVMVSAFTIQWFDNPEESILKTFKQLPECEQAYISYLGAGSFPEWRHYAQLAGVPYTGNTLPKEDKIESALRKEGFQVKAHVQWMNQVYPNALSFFSSIKHIGAGHNLNDQLLSPAQLRRLLRVWDTDCSYGVEVRHKVVFLEIER
ncbi:methyltransferase domain-containing protein [bacterium]|nr:MAG: methyltransferase domain-containing protein [bacterium]